MSWGRGSPPGPAAAAAAARCAVGVTQQEEAVAAAGALRRLVLGAQARQAINAPVICPLNPPAPNSRALAFPPLLLLLLLPLLPVYICKQASQIKTKKLH